MTCHIIWVRECSHFWYCRYLRYDAIDIANSNTTSHQKVVIPIPNFKSWWTIIWFPIRLYSTKNYILQAKIAIFGWNLNLAIERNCLLPHTCKYILCLDLKKQRGKFWCWEGLKFLKKSNISLSFWNAKANCISAYKETNRPKVKVHDRNKKRNISESYR